MAHAVKKMDTAERHRMRHVVSEKQEIAIRALLRGKSDGEAAREAGVDRTTLNRWKNNDAAFLTEIRNRRADIWTDQKEIIREIVHASIAEVLKSIRGGNVRTAQWVLEKTGIEEYVKAAFADMKAYPVDIDNVLIGFAKAEADRRMKGIMNKPPDPRDSLSEEERFMAILERKTIPETPMQIRYRELWRNEYEGALAELREEYGVTDETAGGDKQ